MSNFFYFLFGDKYISLLSFIIKCILKIYGVKIGKNFKSHEFPKLSLKNPKNLILGDNVDLKSNIEIRLYEDSRLEIGNNTKIDDGVRIISANNSLVKIDNDTVVGYNSVINAGSNIQIGKKCLISGFVYLQSSSHGINKSQFIKDQKHTYEEILIKDDVWIGAHSIILKGAKISKGAIIGANSVVKNYVNEYSIVAGSPSREINKR